MLFLHQFDEELEFVKTNADLFRCFRLNGERVISL